MNFSMVGSFFMLFMLNAGWTSNYVIKLVGFLFFAVGTAEAEERTDAFAHLKKPAYTSSAMCALAVVCQLLLKLLSPAAMAANVISILLSAATVYMSLNLMRMFLVALDSHRELVEDVSNIVRLQGSFNKLALMTFIYFGGDLLNRLIPIEFVTTLAGVIAAIAKILVYIFLLIMLYNFNKLRTDYENAVKEKTNKDISRTSCSQMAFCFVYKGNKE